YAHAAIQAIQHNEKPQFFYGATTLFMKIIHDFAINNRITLGDRKYQALLDFEMAHAPIAQENMMRKAQQQVAAAPTDTNAPPTSTPATPTPANAAVPNASTQMRQVAANLP